MPIYKAVHRLEVRKDGKKTVIPSGSQVEISAAEAATLGDAVELISAPADPQAPENNDPGKGAGTGKSSGKKPDSDSE